jgi:predicted transcriptional regulator
MSMDRIEGETVTLELEAEELERIDEIAFRDHRDNREAAIRTLLDEWLKGEHGADDADDAGRADDANGRD